jgi:uncharacterized protein YjdB
MARKIYCFCIAMLSFTFLLISCPNPASGSNDSGSSTGGGETNNPGDNGPNTDGDTGNENLSEITDFSFVLNPLKIRTSYAAQETVVGTISNVEGGTPPYTIILRQAMELMTRIIAVLSLMGRGS